MEKRAILLNLCLIATMLLAALPVPILARELIEPPAPATGLESNPIQEHPPSPPPTPPRTPPLPPAGEDAAGAPADQPTGPGSGRPEEVEPLQPDVCALLDDPRVRGLMSAIFETQLLIECGRENELGGGATRPAVPLGPFAPGTDVLVNDPTGDAGGVSHTQSETTIRVNANTGTICSAYNDSYHGVVQGTGFSGFSSSTDGGLTFVDHGVHPGGGGGVSRGDPSLVWRRADGHFYYAALHTNGLAIWQSTDDCDSFSYLAMIHTGSGDDKELMEVDNNPSSSYYGRFYVAWTDFAAGAAIFVTYSDNGTSWSTPVQVSASGADVQGAWPAVGPNGDVYVAWVRWNPYFSGPIDIEVVRSTNGGVSFSAVTNPLTGGVNPRDATATATCGRPALNGNIRYLPSPQIAVGSDGALHVVYSYDPDGYGSGDVINVYYRRSTDNGTTWGPEVQLNDDGSTTDQWFPTVSVGPGNVVVATWYDRRLDPGSNSMFDYYKAFSYDGGVTWGGNVRVTDASSPVYIDPYLASCYHGDYDQQVQDQAWVYIQWSDDRNVQDGHNDPDIWFEKEPILTEVGTLTGMVYDADTSVPVIGALVQATLSPTMAFGTSSGSGGIYSMIVASGTYTVAALAYGYQPSTIYPVSVVSGTTTTLDIPLKPAAMYVVSGTVTNADHGWPLYAHIAIQGDPVDPLPPYDDLWTEQFTGYYSVTLAEGITYTFNVEAVNHLPESRDVGPLTGNETQDFALLPDTSQDCPPGYVEVSIFYDGFEAGSLGPSWTITTSNQGRVRVDTSDPYSGSYSVLLDDSVDGSLTSIAGIILTQDLSAEPQVYLNFWWHEYSDENDPEDGVFISDDNGATWCQILSFNNGPSTYQNDIVDLTAATTSCGMAFNANFQILFQFYDNYSIPTDGYTIDEVRLGRCAPYASGRVAGYVSDDNTGLPLAGAMVDSDGGQSDTADADGFYELIETPGSHTITATMSGGYGPDVQNPTVVQSDTVRQDFSLPAGWLSYAPSSLEATLDMGLSTTVPFTLTNSGGLSAAFELIELDKGMTFLGPFETPEYVVKLSEQSYPTTEGLELPDPSLALPYAAGDVIQSWSSGRSAAWGIAYDGDDDTVWVGDGWGTEDAIFEYLPDGTSTGRSQPYTWSPPYGPADAAFDWNTGMLWVMNVDAVVGNNCVYEIDPASGYTGNRICPNGTGFSVSQRGLAYDPSTDTYFAGSWNDLMIHHFASDGTMLDEVNVGLAIAGLAYNPDTEHLFVMVNDSPNPVYVLDAADNYALVGQFNVSAGFGDYAGAGLEVDCDGNLWAVDQTTEAVYHFESGETATMCGRDVPWLSEEPITGTVASLANQPITITFDASVPEVTQPGRYHAQLKLKEDTPYGLANIPVTMTVTSLPTWGELRGTVTGLGYCDVNTTTLEGAEVFIEGSSGTTWTLTTGISGTYAYWLDQDTYTVTVSAAEHLTDTTVVAVTAQMTTTHDVALRWLRPCIGVEPDNLAVTVYMGLTTTLPLTLTNSGAAAATFELEETDNGYVLALSLPAVRVPGYRALELEAGETYAGQHLVSRGSWAYQPSMDAFVSSTSADVLLVAAAEATQIQAMLQAYPDINVVDYFDARVGTPTLAQLLVYDTAIVMANNIFTDPVALGDVLADYMDAGGTVIQTVPTFYGSGWGLQGRFVGEGYSPFIGTGDWFSWADLGAFDPTHPIMQGVTAASDDLRQIVNLAAGADPVAEWTDDEFVATKGSVVALNTFLPDGYDWTGDVDLIVHNSVIWLQAGGDVPWLFEDPISGTVSADGGTQLVDVAFDASVPEVTQPGEYYATLKVNSDDPVNGSIGIPVTMTVTPPPTWGKLKGTVTGLGYCDADPTPLEDAEVFIEGSTGMTWTLTTGISGTYAYWLDQGTYTVTVSAADHPTDTTVVAVTAQMTTTHDVGLRWLRPCIGVESDNLAVTVRMGMTSTLPLTLTNSGAAAASFWLWEQDRGFALTQPQPASPLHTGGQAYVVNEDKEATPDTVHHASLPLAGGGPDSFGYTYKDSNEAGGPTYEWIEIAPPAGGSGTALGLSGVDDGYYWPLSLPFAFNFYGVNYTAVSVASNGTVYFDDKYLGMGNTPIPGPNTYGVDTFIAHFWDDLDVDPGEVYYLAQENTFIIEYYQVKGFGTSGDHGTWQVILFENGNTLFQYRDATVGGLQNYGAQATVGIQGDTTTGLQYSYNTPALSDTLAICFAYPGELPVCSEDVPWLSEDPITGTVGSDGGRQLVAVIFDSDVLTQTGEYRATLNVDSDDPVNDCIGIPVTMTVKPMPKLYLPIIMKQYP